MYTKAPLTTAMHTLLRGTQEEKRTKPMAPASIGQTISPTSALFALPATDAIPAALHDKTAGAATCSSVSPRDGAMIFFRRSPLLPTRFRCLTTTNAV